MEINATSIYNFETVKALTHLSLFKKQDPRKSLRLWTIFGGILFAIIILDLILFGFDFIPLILLLYSILILLLEYYLYFGLPKKRYKALSKLQNITNEYVFLQDAVHIKTDGDDYGGECQVKYSLFVKAMETKRYLFLYQTQNQVYIVDKNTLSGGICDELRNLLLSNVKKYIICKY